VLGVRNCSFSLDAGFNNYRQAGQFRDLNAEKRKIMLQVNRGGRRVRVCIYDLVVGDIVHLGIGDQVGFLSLFYLQERLA
jgi:Ca2+-transporting ATPase